MSVSKLTAARLTLTGLSERGVPRQFPSRCEMKTLPVNSSERASWGAASLELCLFAVSLYSNRGLKSDPSLA